jgi:hypothetical protein
LVTPATTLWLSSVTVPIFLALDRLMIIFAMRASWVVMFDFLFLPRVRVRYMPSILFTVIYGLLQFLVFLAASTIWSWSMISLTTLGLSPCVPSLRRFPPSTSLLWVSTQFGLTIKVVQCDNGCEFDNHTSRSFFLSQGVQLRMSCPYTSPQNGKAERMIRTTNDVMRTLPIQASLPPCLWAEYLNTSTYSINRLPSTASPAPTPHHSPGSLWYPSQLRSPPCLRLCLLP